MGDVMNIPDFPAPHVLPRQRYEIVRPKSHAARQWMVDAHHSREIIRRKGGKFVVIEVYESSLGGFEAHLQELIILKMPPKIEIKPKIPFPGFYY